MVRIESNHCFVGCFAPNNIMKGCVSIAVNNIWLLYMVKSSQILYKMNDKTLYYLCNSAVAIIKIVLD